MLDRIDKWVKIRVGGGLMLVLTLWLVHGQQIRAIHNRLSQKTNFETQIAEAQLWREITTQIRHQNQLLSGKLDKLYLEIPENDVLSAIIGFIQHAGQDANIELVAIAPGTPAIEDEVQRMSFTLTVQGKFAGIGEFIFLLETSPYVLSVNYIDLSAAGMTTSTLTCRLEIVVFQFAQAATARSQRKNS